MLVTPAPEAVMSATQVRLGAVPVHPEAMAAGVGAVQMVKSGMLPGLWRFQVPPQRAPLVGLTSAILRLLLP